MENNERTNALNFTEGTANIFGVPQVFTVPKVAEIIGSNKEYVRKLIKSGELRAIKLGGIKVTSMELVRFLTENAGKDLNDPFNPKDLVA